MKILINERLSKHRCKTPEGYLICTDAILARTGKQTYRKNEIFKDSDDETEIEVDRTEDEVFSPQTLASFENKPVTVEHPDEDVNVHNYKEYAVGFVRDVHRGEVNGQPVILGNLVITDEQTIQEIENGEHTDLSCGYDCDIADEANPCQRNIRGNHVALCEQGRAGIARIVDSANDGIKDESAFVIYNARNHKYWSVSKKEWVNEEDEGITIFAKSDDAWDYAKTNLSKSDARIMKYFDSVKDSVKDEQLYAVEFTYDGDSWSNYLGHVNVRAKSKQDALTKAKRWAVAHYDNPGFFKIASTKYTNVETIDSVKDAQPSKLGDKVRFRNRVYVIIKVQKGKNDDVARLTLRPLERFDEKDKPFEGGGDSYWDIHIERWQLDDSVKDTRMKVANLTNGYAIVPESRWRKLGLNTEVERFTTNLNEARDIRSSLERNDGISFVIVDVTQRRTTDSMKDALIPPTKEAINKFEALLRIFDIKIDRKGLTLLGRVHYQVRSNTEFDRFVHRLERIDDEMDKLGIPMTFNAGSDGKTCTAGIDLDKQYVKDSQRTQKSQKIIKAAKSIK